MPKIMLCFYPLWQCNFICEQHRIHSVTVQEVDTLPGVKDSLALVTKRHSYCSMDKGMQSPSGIIQETSLKLQPRSVHCLQFLSVHALHRPQHTSLSHSLSEVFGSCLLLNVSDQRDQQRKAIINLILLTFTFAQIAIFQANICCHLTIGVVSQTERQCKEHSNHGRLSCAYSFETISAVSTLLESGSEGKVRLVPCF